MSYSNKTSILQNTVVLIALSCFSPSGLIGQSGSGQGREQNQKNFPLLNWDGGLSCRAKGRLQDKEYCDSKIMEQVIAQGKSAIPVLISQVTDTRELKEPIFDFWSRMTVGDVANAILGSLFTDSDGKTFNMPGLEAIRPECGDSAEACWQMVLNKHGRKFVQDEWLAAWSRNKDRIYWDAGARCFRLSQQ